MWLQNNIFLEAIVLLIPLLPIMFWPVLGRSVGQKFQSRLMLFGQLIVLLAGSVLTYRGLDGLIIDFSGVVFKFSFNTLILQLVVALLVTVTLCFSFGYMNRDSSPGRFYSLLIPTQSTLFLFIGADNNLLSWGGLFSYTLLSGLLMAYYYSDLDKVQRTVRSFIVEGIGLLALLALCLLPEEFAHGSFAAWMFIIFIVCQCSQFPCHVWGGEVAAAPSPATALMQGGYSILVALFAWVRFLPLVDFSMVNRVLMCVAVLTMVCGATYGLLQWNIKRLFSYVTINRLGFLLLLFSLAAGQGVSLLGLSLCLAAVLFSLYLGAAIIIRYLGDRQQLEMMGALYKKQPLLTFFFFLCFYFILPLPFSPFLLAAGEAWQNLLSVSLPSWGRYLLMALYLLAEFAQACLLCRFWCRVFFKKPVMDVTADSPSCLPLTMTVSYMFSVLLAVLSVVCYWLDDQVSFPDSWWLLFMPLLGWVIVSIYMYGTKTHYFPGHYRALRHEQFLNDLSQKLLVRPLMIFSEVLLKRFIGQWCIRMVQTVIAVAMRIGGYVLMWLHRGDLRYYLAIFFIGMVIVAVSAGVI